MRKLLLCLVLVGLLVFALGGTASAAKAPTLKSLAKTVAALQKTVKSQAATIASQGQSITTLNAKVSADEATIGSQGQTIGSLSATVAGHTATLSAAAPLLAIAPYVSLHLETMNGVNGANIVFQRCNVHVRSTAAETDSDGLGNLIVGWDNNPTSTPTGYRSAGSNNLVVGDQNSFSGWGGFVAGSQNSVSTTFASVSGGQNNGAGGGFGDSVSGGSYNMATGICGSISGGSHNQTTGNFSSISGGGGSTYLVGLVVSVDYGWKAGNTATPGTGTAKYSAP